MKYKNIENNLTGEFHILIIVLTGKQKNEQMNKTVIKHRRLGTHALINSICEDLYEKIKRMMAESHMDLFARLS